MRYFIIACISLIFFSCDSRLQHMRSFIESCPAGSNMYRTYTVDGLLGHSISVTCEEILTAERKQEIIKKIESEQ